MEKGNRAESHFEAAAYLRAVHKYKLEVGNDALAYTQQLCSDFARLVLVPLLTRCVYMLVACAVWIRWPYGQPKQSKIAEVCVCHVTLVAIVC